MNRPPSRTITCMMLSASLAIWTLAGETSFSQTQAEGAPESPPIIQEDTSPSEGQGEVIERGTTRDHRGQQKLLPPRQRTLPAPETFSPVIRDQAIQPDIPSLSQTPTLQITPKVTSPSIVAPTPGTALPPDRYQAPTPNLTLIANALRLNHKSLTTLVTLPPNLPVTRPVDIGIIYSSSTGIGQTTKQSYARGTGNRFLYNDREGDGKPRAIEIAITLTEPSVGEAGIYRMKWQANLDPLYDVAVGRFEFTLLNFCDKVGQTEIIVAWSLPDASQVATRSFSIGIVPDTTNIPEFSWARSEISWSQLLHREMFKFYDDDPGWVHALSTFAKQVKNLEAGFENTAKDPLPLLTIPTGGRWVEEVRRAENGSCKGKYKYWQAKNLLLYPTLQTR